MGKDEQTYIMVKPDGVQRGLTHEIIERFERKGYKLVALKMMNPSAEHYKEHYKDLVSLPFFPSLLAFMTSGPVVGMVWQGTDVVAQGRKMLGKTKPLESEPGTIRGDFCIDVGRNVVHGSDSVESAKREIALWFKPEEVIQYEKKEACLVYE